MPVFSRCARAVAVVYRPLVGVLAVLGIGIMLWKEKESVSMLRNVHVGIGIVIGLLIAVNFVLFGVRVKYVIERLGRFRLRPLWWQRVFLNSYALNSVVAQAGALYRAYELKKEYDLDVLDYVRAYYFIVWLGTILILLFSATLMKALSLPEMVQGWNVVHVSLLASAVLTSAPVAVFYAIPRLFPGSNRFTRVRGVLRDTFAFTVESLRDGRFMVLFVVISAAAFCVDVGIVRVSVQALGYSVPFEVAVLMYVLPAIFGLIRITPGNIGVQELVFGVIGVQAGLAMGDGVVVSIFLRVMRVIAVVMLLAAVNAVYGVLRLKRAV